MKLEVFTLRLDPGTGTFEDTALAEFLTDREATLDDLLDRTPKFPKAVRFTFSTRIDNLALDVHERLVAARCAPAGVKREAMRYADLSLARLRVLLRLVHKRRYLDHRGYRHVSERLDEAGRMLGGWLAHDGGR